MESKYLLKKSHIKAGFVIKLIAIISCIYGLCVGIHAPQDMTYFTNLSNILILIALIASLIFDVIILKTDGAKNPKNNLFFITKFIFTLCISITWLIYMCILAPTSDAGFIRSYMGNHYGSLCLHMITPVLALVDFILFDYNYKSTGIHSVYAVIPPLFYVGFIVILASTGMRWKHGMSAPYNFLNFGAEVGWFGFDLSTMSSSSLGIGVAYMIIVLVLIFIAIGRLFLLFKDLRYKKVCK